MNDTWRMIATIYVFFRDLLTKIMGIFIPTEN